MTRILAIETSCDETAVAIVDDGRRVLCNLVATQFDVHAKYGGVVPELASRAHVEKLDLLVREALAALEPGSPVAETSDRVFSHPSEFSNLETTIDALAVTHRPGLIGALLIGLTAAKTLAWAWRKPLIPVDHIRAHAVSAAMSIPDDPWPAISLVVSGGHTSLYLVRDYDDITCLGATTDDAVGEAFDKVAAILRLGYPGGPIIDRLSREGRPDRFAFPRTLLDPDSLDFSFSGLKTAVLYAVHGPGKTTGGLEKLSDQDVRDLCASFSAAAVDVLVRKSLLAVEQSGVRVLCIGGGVACNSMLRARLASACDAAGIRLFFAEPRYCTDNAAMIGFLAHHLLRRGCVAGLDLTAATATT